MGGVRHVVEEIFACRKNRVTEDWKILHDSFVIPTAYFYCHRILELSLNE